MPIPEMAGGSRLTLGCMCRHARGVACNPLQFKVQAQPAE